MTAVMNIVEDEAGTVASFALYMQLPETFRAARSILKEKRVIILKEPYFKVRTNGQYAIRVDQPTDIFGFRKTIQECQRNEEAQVPTLLLQPNNGRRGEMTWLGKQNSTRQWRCELPVLRYPYPNGGAGTR
jgi:hypothetical protein